jgi:hypothetical protein
MDALGNPHYPAQQHRGPLVRTYLVFGDIEGKLDMLRVECTRCGRKGRDIAVDEKIQRKLSSNERSRPPLSRNIG